MQETSYLEGREYWLEKLKDMPFLQSLEKRHLAEMLNVSKIRKYEPGELIIAEGAYEDWLYIMISGAVRVVKHGREIARLDHFGEVFGELAAIDGASRSAFVYAVTRVLCLAVHTSFMDKVDPKEQKAFFSVLYRMISEIIADRLRATNEDLARTRAELAELRKALGEAALQTKPGLYTAT